MVTLPVKPIDHLPLLTIHNLAMISDWLDENGELFVAIYLLRSGGGSSPYYFVQSMRDLKYLLWEYGFWDELHVTIYHRPQLLLRGTANAEFLEKALRQFRPEQLFYVVDFAYYPNEAAYINRGRGHIALVNMFTERWGHSIALSDLDPVHDLVYGTPADIFNVRRDHEGYEEYTIERNQEAYALYDADPARYQWLVDMWRE